MAKEKLEDLEWTNLGFKYRDLPYSFQAVYKDGAWQEGGLTEDSTIVLSEAAQVLHYGQEVFEGLKAYRWKDGSLHLFRPEENAARLRRSAERMSMAPYPEDKFVEACKEVVKANADFVPPYGSGGTLYLRPFLIGSEPIVGVDAAQEYIFRIYATPVGAYINGLHPAAYMVSAYDRAAHAGTGRAKTSGNYAASLYPHELAKKLGYADALYLDPREHKYVDEFGGANFFGITKEGNFVTPKSVSVLPSITKKSLLVVAQDLGLNPQEVRIPFDEVDDLVEAGAMGTAAVISPVGSLTYNDEKHVFYSETEAGPITTKLYETLTGIQNGDLPDTHNWTVPVE
ncbi:branched-chain amino acid aminotransferase [Ligilactobacillus equi]|uniref:branched-chain amino acid aminotransferase n=1 Tax=Ligilactobacillus equi TaxID=137357 RepID=UPI002ED634DD|nr:branched-chain amino acid aminotransferase [Ligilactobacillus sp.]